MQAGGEVAEIGKEVPDGVLAEDAALEAFGQEGCLVIGEVLAPQVAAVVLFQGGNVGLHGLKVVEGGIEPLHCGGGTRQAALHAADAGRLLVVPFSWHYLFVVKSRNKDSVIF